MELQKKELLDLAEKAGLTVLGIAIEYPDECTLDRRTPNEIRKAVSIGNVEFVLTNGYGRISRSIRLFQEFIRFLQKHHVSLLIIQNQQIIRRRAV